MGNWENSGGLYTAIIRPLYGHWLIRIESTVYKQITHVIIIIFFSYLAQTTNFNYYSPFERSFLNNWRYATSGRVGHSSNLCPRDDYSPDIPALTCSQCVRRVTTATGGDTNFEIYIGVDPCAQHATHTAQPPTQAAPSSFSQAVASHRPPSYSAATSSSSTSNPTSVGAPVQCPCYSPTPYDSSYQCCPSQCPLEAVSLKRRTFRRWRI